MSFCKYRSIYHAELVLGNQRITMSDHVDIEFTVCYSNFLTIMYDMKEQVQRAYNAIFWSFSCKNYQRTNWWSKTANSNVSNLITIRTATTMRKVLGVCHKGPKLNEYLGG